MNGEKSRKPAVRDLLYRDQRILIDYMADPSPLYIADAYYDGAPDSDGALFTGTYDLEELFAAIDEELDSP